MVKFSHQGESQGVLAYMLQNEITSPLQYFFLFKVKTSKLCQVDFTTKTADFIKLICEQLNGGGMHEANTFRAIYLISIRQLLLLKFM